MTWRAIVVRFVEFVPWFRAVCETYVEYSANGFIRKMPIHSMVKGIIDTIEPIVARFRLEFEMMGYDAVSF